MIIKTLLWCLLFFLLNPLLIYCLCYLPDKVWKDDVFSIKNVFEHNLMMFKYHHELNASHPFEARWYEWLLDLRPIWYYGNINDGVSNTIACFSNPLLTWFGLPCIVYTLFKERGVEIPREIAGALLSGLLSDTLILKSPTATPKDVEAVKELASIAKVDYQKYGMDMLKAGTSLEGMSKEDVLYNDFKLYTVNEKTFAVGQFFTMNFDEMKKELDDYVKTLDEISEANHYDFLALYVTDIIQNGSYVIFNTKGQEVVDVMYEEENIPEGYFVENCVSRKKHVVPLVMEVFEN